jgi:hypothetical protein
MTLKVPAVLRVPEMRPVLDEIESPGGRPPAEYVNGSERGSVALNWRVTLRPTTPV